MSDDPNTPIDPEGFFPEPSGEQPPPGIYRNVPIRKVTNLGKVTSATFKDKFGLPICKPMVEVAMEFSINGTLLTWKRTFTLTTSNKGSLFPLYLAATGQPPRFGGPGAKAMEGKCVDLEIRHEPGQNGGMWAKIAWATAPSSK